ncbi:unnamed protein product [Allacma fusca]|uniref:Oxidation resistance protein 1 n=1 Tax=Allacma fusca TaxID=39272 RepID=A0A8J2PRL8_9HEXA|nr:unnamed protein product [Allacma fusca]
MSENCLNVNQPKDQERRRSSQVEELVHEYEIKLCNELKVALQSHESGEFHPELIVGRSEILDFDDVINLSKNINEECPWFLTFSSYVHDRSLETLYNKASSFSGPSLIIIKTTNKQVFGALLSDQPRLSNAYYGTCQSFLVQCRPNFKIYRATGIDIDFLLGCEDSFAIGKKDINGNCALRLNATLTEGRTTECPTYGNQPLAPEINFQIKILECWHFGCPN